MPKYINSRPICLFLDAYTLRGSITTFSRIVLTCALPSRSYILWKRVLVRVKKQGKHSCAFSYWQHVENFEPKYIRQQRAPTKYRDTASSISIQNKSPNIDKTKLEKEKFYKKYYKCIFYISSNILWEICANNNIILVNTVFLRAKPNIIL